MGENFFSAASSDGLWFPESADETQQLFYESVAQFAAERMGPAEAALAARDYELARDLFRECAELGVFAAELDESDGGLGFGVIDATLLSEAVGRGHSLSVGLMVHQGVGMLPIACFGNEAQRERYLPRAAAGECIMAFALTEPHCGSDALALTTSAVSDAGGFRLNGAKQFITNGAYADCFITFARVPDVGITAFLVDAGRPGLSVGPEEKKLGQHASSTCSVFYEDVLVDESSVLGIPGQGHKIALSMLNLGRLKLAAACVGKMKVLLPEAVRYTEERTAFGQPIVGFGMVRDRLARMASLLYAVESTVYRVASVLERALEEARGDAPTLGGQERLKVLQDFALECAVAKSFGTESLGTFTDDMLQLYGGYGFSEEYPAAKAFRDARVTRLYEGTTEICRLTMMQRLLGLCGEPQTRFGADADFIGKQKELVYTVLRHQLEAQSGDVGFVMAKQVVTGPLMAICERLYAMESVRLRQTIESVEGKYLAACFRASAIADNLADFHRVFGRCESLDSSSLWDPETFPIPTTDESKDYVVAALRDVKGVLGSGPPG